MHPSLDDSTSLCWVLGCADGTGAPDAYLPALEGMGAKKPAPLAHHPCLCSMPGQATIFSSLAVYAFLHVQGLGRATPQCVVSVHAAGPAPV